MSKKPLIQILVDWNNTGQMPAREDFDRALFNVRDERLTKDEWAAVQDMLTKYGVDDKAVKSIVHSAKVIHKLGCYPELYEEFVEVFMERNDIHFEIDDMFRDSSGTTLADDIVYNRLLLTSAELNIFENKNYLKAAFDNWKYSQRRILLNKILENIEYDGDPRDDLWDLVVWAVLKDDLCRNETYFNATKIVLKNFIWRAKKLTSGGEGDDITKHHVMPYFFGPQIGGKSSFLEWFLTPYQNAFIVEDFKMFESEFSQSSLRKIPIIWFDEMGWASKSDVDKVKKVMTSTKTRGRDPYQASSSAKNISTFIGSGNKDLDEIIRDTTGTRRFFEIPTKRRLQAQELVDTFDAAELWRSVDGQLESPYGRNKDWILPLQEEQRPVSALESWLFNSGDDNLHGVTYDTKEKSSRLFRDFSAWCEVNYPSERPNIQSFGNEIKRIKEEGKITIDIIKSNYTYYIIHNPVGDTPDNQVSQNIRNKGVLTTISKGKTRNLWE